MTRIDGIDLTEPGAGRLLPPTAFTSPAVFAAEMERIFTRSWVHVADLPELREAGSFVAATIGRVQRGLRAHGLPPGVHTAFLEARIGHFEHLVVRALAEEPDVARRPLARPDFLTYETRPNGGAA